MGMFSAIRAALRALAHRGEVAEKPLPVKPCRLNATPHRCNDPKTIDGHVPQGTGEALAREIETWLRKENA